MAEQDEELMKAILREEMEKGALARAKEIKLDLSGITSTFDAALSEAPRSTSILIAALLDDELTRYMQRQLYLTSALREKIFSGNGPLSVLSGKIDLSVALAWIAPSCGTELHLIRKIRNEFAHNPSIHTFNEDPILALTKKMEFSEEMLRKMGLENLIKRCKADAKMRYIVSCVTTLHLFLRTVVVGPVSLQYMGGKRVYAPKYDDMSPSEQAVIDWCMRYLKKLEAAS